MRRILVPLLLLGTSTLATAGPLGGLKGLTSGLTKNAGKAASDAKEASGNLLGQKLKVNRVVAPPNPVSGIKTIGFGSFDGFGSEPLQGSIKRALLNPHRGDRHDAAPALREGFVVNVFKFAEADADAILTASVSQTDNDEGFTQKMKKRDSSGKVVKDAKGNAVKVDVACTRRTVKVTASWTLSSADGATLATGNEDAVTSDNKCGEKVAALAEPAALAKKSLQELGATVVNAFAPRWEVHALGVRKKGDIKEPAKAARRGEWKEAICGFRSIVEADPYNVHAIYDLGVLYEMKGWYDQAKERYEMAESVKGDKDADKGAQRVAQRIGALDEMAKTHGGQRKTLSPPAGLCEGFEEQAETMANQPPRGQLKKAVALRAAPEAGSSSIRELPKGLRLTILEQAESMTRVSTPDGKEGWVPSNVLKTL